MRRTIAAACVAVALLASGCGNQGGIEIIRACGPDRAAHSADPRCAHRDGFPDRADGKEAGPFRPRGF
jgi:hypothetical protein